MSGSDVGLLVRALAGLSVIGASLAWFFAVPSAGLARFVQSNQLGNSQRILLLLALGLGALLGAAPGFSIWWVRRGGVGLARVAWFARLLAPLAVLGFARGLLQDAWPDSLTFALTLSAFLLALEPLLRMHFAARAERPILHIQLRPIARSTVFAFVIAAAAAHACYFAFFAIRNHHNFNTFNYDLGQYDNLFYNFLHGRPMRCTPLFHEGNWSELRNHADLSVFFLLPFYALAPRAETLLVLQAVIVGSAAIPLFLFARRRISQGAAALLAAAYLLYPAMHGPLFFDFHFQPIAAGVVIWAVDCLDRRAHLAFAIFFIIALGCREDISVGLTLLGLFLILTGHRPKAGAIIAAISLGYFVTMRFVVMPRFGTWFFADIYKQLFPPGQNSFAGVVATLLTNPLFAFTTLLTADKLRYGLQILTPVAFLPLRRVQLWLALMPGLFFTILTTQYSPTTDLSFQYSGHFTAYIFLATALALAAYGNDLQGAIRRRAALITLLAGTAIATAQWGAVPPRKQFRAGFATVRFDPPSASDLKKAQDLRELAALIPPDAPLASSDRELPHLSNRLDCYWLSDGYEGADYIIYVPYTGGRDGEQAQRALNSGQWQELARRPGLALLKRKGAPVVSQ